MWKYSFNFEGQRKSKEVMKFAKNEGQNEGK